MDFRNILRLVTKGDVRGHEFHGNQYTGGIGGGNEPHYVAFIRSHMDKFYGSGGKIESVESEKTATAVANEIVAIERAISNSDNERLELGVEEMRASVTQHLELLANRNGNGGDDQKPFFLVARDANGNLAACINGVKDDYGVRIGNLGSAQIIKGSATALQERVAQLADGKPVSSYALWDAVPYHISIGREVDTPTDEETEQAMKNGDTQIASYWNADTVKEIAALPSPEPSVVKSASNHWLDEVNPFWQTPEGKALLAKIQITKGDVTGHEFHGNQWTGGTGGDGDWKPTMTRAQADGWAKNSAIQIPLYHATENENLKSILSNGLRPSGSGAFGNGIYSTDSKQEADDFVSVGGETLELRANVQNIWNLDAMEQVDKFIKDTAEALENGSIVKNEGDSFSEAMRKYAVSLGYDCIRIPFHDPSYQYNVLDPKNITVISDKVAKGESKGHPFRGNQYTQGEGGGEPEVSPELRQHIRDFAESTVPSQFVETYANNLSKILASPERYEKLRADLVAGGDNSFGGSDITAIAMLSGTGGVPKVVSNSEFSKIDSPTLYQGLVSGGETMNPGAIRPAEGITAENMVANFAYNPIPHFGGGDYGIAYYTSQDPSVSLQYAQGEDNAMLRMKLSPDAMTVSYDKAEGLFGDAYEPMKSLLEEAGFKNFDVENTRETSWFLGTMNTTVALCGISALTRDTPYGQYTMVIDRSQVNVADTYSRIDTSYWAGTTTTGVYDETPLLAPKDFGENGGTGASPKITNVKIDRSLTKSLVQKGDVAGHEFHGNQWIDGQGNFKPNGGRRTASPKTNRIAQTVASMRGDKKEPSPKDTKFVALSSTQIAKNVGYILDLGGDYNKGWQKVEMSDGSIAGVKTFQSFSVSGVMDAIAQAQNEVLASAVGKELDIPIRDTAFVGDRKWLSTEPQVVQPWIKGKTAFETPIPDTPEAQNDMKKLEFFDQLIDNGDRFENGVLLNDGNVMVTDKGSVVGIDHAFAFPEKNSLFYNSAPMPDFNLLGSPTREELDNLHAQIMSTEPNFTAMGRRDSFANMMTRFETGAITYMTNKGMV